MSSPASHAIRLLVAHADPLVHAGLVAATAADARFHALEVPVGDVAARLRSQEGGTFRIVVTDYEHGIELLQLLHDRRRDGLAGVVIVTNRNRETEVQRALSLGVAAYLMADCSLDELSSALETVDAGRLHLSKVAGQRMVDGMFHERLTPRETQVLRCLTLGYANKQIARDLEMSVGTVKSHMRSLLGKLGVSSRVQVILEAERRGLVASSEAPHPLPTTSSPVHAMASKPLRQGMAIGSF